MATLNAEPTQPDATSPDATSPDARSAPSMPPLWFALGRDFAMQSLATPISAELPVVYVGHGWVIPGRQIDPYAGVDVKGKLVLAHGPRALPQGVQVQQLGRVAIDAETPLAAAAARAMAWVRAATPATTSPSQRTVSLANINRSWTMPP